MVFRPPITELKEKTKLILSFENKPSEFLHALPLRRKRIHDLKELNVLIAI